MSWGIGNQVGIAIGLGSIATFFSGYGRNQEFNNLITENNFNIVQEDGSFILV